MVVLSRMDIIRFGKLVRGTSSVECRVECRVEWVRDARQFIAGDARRGRHIFIIIVENREDQLDTRSI